MKTIRADWAEVTDRGLELVRRPTWEEWTSIATPIKTLHSALPMVIGDWLNAGEDTFGQKFSQALDLFGDYEYGTLANYAYVTRRVPFERRKPGLRFGHYRAVCKLEPEQQEYWLDVAVKKGLTSRELHQAIWGQRERDEVKDLWKRLIRLCATIVSKCPDAEWLWEVKHNAELWLSRPEAVDERAP